MIKYHGSVASKGVAIGVIKELQQKQPTIRREKITDIEGEKARFFKAQATTMAQLEGLYELAIKEVGESNALIFEIHRMMVEDDDYVDSIINIIETQQVAAPYAVAVTGDNFAQTFSSMDDDYMKERAADVKDISDRLIHCLCGSFSNNLIFDEPCIVVADDLTPSETVQMDKSKILAFVTRGGSVNSHTAILARTMSIPAIVGVDVPVGVNSQMAVVDGFKACFVLEPDEQVIAAAKLSSLKEEKRKRLLEEFKDKETVTKSGAKINLYANVGSVGDIGLALQNDAEGIGLFRSEFLYLEQSDYPSEELQFGVYKQAAQMMGGKKVIIRTMDIGADKKIGYFNLEHEENPALGYRAIRICLTQEDMFKTQLRALIRASLYGKIAIMVPMIISLWEIEMAKKLIEEVKADLTAHGIEFGEFDFGIMIETPAAALMADEFAKHVDFFSIGTNDLTQYTLAIDRQNQKLERFYQADHPAVLKMIEMVAKAANDNGIWAGICGELGANEDLCETFVSYGIKELSVSPSSILSLRQKIRELDQER